MPSIFEGNSILALIAQLRAVFVGRDELVTGTAITNLNADMVDGLHAATSGANAHVLATDSVGTTILNDGAAAGTFGLSVLGAAGVARDIFQAGMSGISNGFTVRYNGSAMTYNCLDVPVYANNAAAIAGGLTAGTFYRNGADPDHLCVVH